jgi:hypothetical protein
MYFARARAEDNTRKQLRSSGIEPGTPESNLDVSSIEVQSSVIRHKYCIMDTDGSRVSDPGNIGYTPFKSLWGSYSPLST